MFWNHVVVIVARLCEHTKTHCIIHLEMNQMKILELKPTISKKKKVRWMNAE